MRIRTTLALAASALMITALPAAADSNCDDEVAHTLHELEDGAGPAGPAVHAVEGAYCGLPTS